MNPALLVEVLSPSAEGYDRGEKLGHYQKIPALREVVFVAHDARTVETVRRSGDTWSVARYGPGETAPLESLGCELSVDDVFRDPLGS